jgi:hypothetical protein
MLQPGNYRVARVMQVVMFTMLMVVMSVSVVMGIRLFAMFVVILVLMIAPRCMGMFSSFMVMIVLRFFYSGHIVLHKVFSAIQGADELSDEPIQRQFQILHRIFKVALLHSPNDAMAQVIFQNDLGAFHFSWRFPEKKGGVGVVHPPPLPFFRGTSN